MSNIPFIGSLGGLALAAAVLAIGSLRSAGQGATSSTVTGGTVQGGSATGGSATGGSVSATGGSATVTGGSATGGSATGGSATGGTVTNSVVTQGTSTPGTSSVSVNGRRIVASADGGASIQATGDTTTVQIGQHVLTITKEQLLLDGKAHGNIPANAAAISINAQHGRLNVTADGKKVLSEKLVGP